MDNQGWVKVYRKMLNNPISKKPHYSHLWTNCLLLAQHEATSFIWNNKRISLNPGQFVTGRRKLSKMTGISESYVEKILKYLEKEQQITQEKTNKFRIITIVNWGEYQQKDNNGTTTRTTKRQQRGQQKDTYKKDKNVKKEKKTTGVQFPDSFNTEEFRKAWSDWEQHRIEKRQKLTPTTIDRQLKSLGKLSVQKAIAKIENSIEKGYTGLYEGNKNGRHSTIGQGRTVESQKGIDTPDGRDFDNQTSRYGEVI